MRARAIFVATGIFRPADSGRTEYALEGGAFGVLDFGREAGARAALDADRDHSGALHEAAIPPVADEALAQDLGGARAVGHVVGIIALVAGLGRPAVVAEAFAFVVAIGALETVDRLAVLEPLHDAAPLLLAGRAGAAPHRAVLEVRVPVPHAAAVAGVEQPVALVARLGPADLKGVRFLRRAIRLRRDHRHLLGERRRADPLRRRNQQNRSTDGESHGPSGPLEPVENKRRQRDKVARLARSFHAAVDRRSRALPRRAHGDDGAWHARRAGGAAR